MLGQNFRVVPSLPGLPFGPTTSDGRRRLAERWTNDEQHKVEEADVEAVEAPWIRPRGLEEGW